MNPSNCSTLSRPGSTQKAVQTCIHTYILKYILGRVRVSSDVFGCVGVHSEMFGCVRARRSASLYVCMYASLYDFFGSPLVETELDNLWIYSSHFDCVVTKVFWPGMTFSLSHVFIHTYIHTYLQTSEPERTRTHTNEHE
jgi:hypothetical protein